MKLLFAERSGVHVDHQLIAFAFSSVPFAIIVTVIVALVMAMHHENIGRLLAGTEPRIGARK